MNEKNLDACRDKFIDYLLRLLNAVCEKNPRDPSAIDALEKFRIVRKEIPNRIIEMVGPYIWEERERIKGNINVAYFLSDEFADKIQRKASEIPEVSEFTNVVQLHKVAKHTWQCVQEAEREVLKKYVQGLLVEYAKYIKVMKVMQTI